jgi:hypothetical protein
MVRKMLFFIAKTLMLLEYIPAYRRYWTWHPDSEKKWTVNWSYRRPGTSGFGWGAISRLGLMDLWFEESTWWCPSCKGSGKGKDELRWCRCPHPDDQEYQVP